MKHLYYLILFFSIQPAFSQSYCPPNGITTNPAAPVNPLEPGYRNYFDWATTSPYYSINSSCISTGSTVNPFQSNQTEMLPLAILQDNKPSNGWEIVAYNLGYDNNNIMLPSQPQHTYVMLYNKYTGILRILVKWCPISSYNGALLTLKFAPGFQTNILDMATGEKALNAPHVLNPSLSTTLNFYNDSQSWAYADFKMNYDPCTCSFTENARLALYTNLISASNVQLTGKITGTISMAGSGNSNANGNFWKSAQSINGTMMKAHKGLTDFAQNYQQIYSNLNDAGVTIGAINSIGSFLNNNDFMKAGLKALPYVSAGVKFLSGLFGGSGANSVQIPPLSVNLDVRISGSITTTDPMHNATVGLPGSQKQNVIPGFTGGQPLYNETMGIFSLFNTPVMYYTEETVSKSFTNREHVDNPFSADEYWEYLNQYNFVNRKYKLSGETLKYAINPASGLSLQDAEVMLVVEYEKPSLMYSKIYPSPKVTGVDTDADNGLIIFGTDRGPAIDVDNNMFQNAYKPIGIYNFKNDYSFTFLNRIAPVSGKKRELNYNPNTTPSQRFSCQDFQCSWDIAATRPFAFEQPQPAINVLSQLTTSHFKLRTGIPFPYIDKPVQDFLEPRVKAFKLKFVLNLKRTDVPDAQNVLYVVTYPVELKPAPAGYNIIGSSYVQDAETYRTQGGFMPAVPTNKVLPVTQGELTTFCTTLYKTATTRNSGTGKMEENLTVAEIGKPVLYPVPAKGELHIIQNGSVPVAIMDIYGKIIKRFDGVKTVDGEIQADISNLKTGLYLLSYQDKDGNLRSVKFTVE